MGATVEISLKAIVQLIEDRLDDLQVDGLLTSGQYGKKRQLRQIINAVNDADIAICSELKIKRQVAVFVPEGRTDIPLFIPVPFNLDPDWVLHAGVWADSGVWDEGEVWNDDPDIDAFILQEQSFLDASDVVGRKVYVYDRYPMGKNRPVSELRFATYEQVRGGGSSCHIHFEPGSRRFRLTQAFSKDVFILFEAHIIPYKMDADRLRDITAVGPETYYIRTPGYGQRLLIERSLKNLLGYVVANKAGILAAEEYEDSRIADRGASGGMEILVPSSDYPWG